MDEASCPGLGLLDNRTHNTFVKARRLSCHEFTQIVAEHFEFRNLSIDFVQMLRREPLYLTARRLPLGC
jgi:hypothetical protein